MSFLILDYRLSRTTSVWTRLGRFTTAKVVLDFPAQLNGKLFLRGRYTDTAGKPWGPGKETAVTLTRQVDEDDRPDPKAVVFDAPAIAAGPGAGTIAVTPKVPSAAGKPDEFTVDVLTGEDGAAVEDLVYIGTVQPGETILVPRNPDADEQTVAVIPVRDLDDVAAAPVTVDVAVPQPDGDYETVLDFDDDFSGTGPGTQDTVLFDLDPLAPVAGPAGVEFASSYIGDMGGQFIGDAGGIFIGDAGVHVGPAIFNHGEVDGVVVHDFELVVWPEVQTVTRPVQYIGDAQRPILQRDTLNDDTPDDRGRLTKRQDRIFADETPVIVQHEVQTHDGTAYNGTWLPLRLGHVYRAQKYKMRTRFFCTRRCQVKFRRIKVIRRIKNRKYEQLVAASWDVAGEQTVTFDSVLAPFVNRQVATATIRQTSSETDLVMCCDVHSLTTTSCVVRVYQIDKGDNSVSVPTTTNKEIHLVITGW